MENFYQTLGLANFSPFEEIQRAYNKMYGELFVSDSPLANIPRIKELKEIFDTLSDPDKRLEYDKKLKVFLDTLEKQYEKAVDSLSSGDYENCIKIIRECIKKNPKEPDFYETLGLAYQLSGFLEEASKIFQQGLSLKIKPAMFNWYLGDLYRALHDNDKAETHLLDAAEGFKEILKVDPRNIEAMELLADTYSKMKWYEEALEVFEKLLEQFPYKADYHRDVGSVLYELEMLEDAEEHLHEALRNNPDDSSSYLFLGLVFFKRRLLSMAVHYLDESLKRNPGQPEVVKLIGKIKEIQKDVGRTVEEIISDPEPDAVVEGTVKWYNVESGVGVITCSEYPEVLLHHTALKPEDRDTLEKGESVRFGVVKDKVGPIAVQVERLGTVEGSDTLPGIIERFDMARKIGAIKGADEKEILFHFSALTAEMENKVSVGCEVIFEVKTIKGLADEPIVQAINIRPRKKTKAKKPKP